jgi:hypothetical protein
VILPGAEQILDNPVPLSLRLSGVLLLGAVNVYAIKLDMLLKDSYRALEALEQVQRTAFLWTPRFSVNLQQSN